MCARFSLPADGVVANLFGVDGLEIEHLGIGAPIYNFAPSRVAPVLVGPDHKLTSSPWGIDLHSTTWKGPLINIKAETALARFRALIEGDRCLIPASGFFEWETIGKKKQPWRFVLKDEEPFCFAGLMRKGRFAVLTTEPNEAVSDLHDRMPCVLRRSHFHDWLTGSPSDALDLALVSPDAKELARYRVDPKMGNPRFEDASAIEPMAQFELGL